MINVVRKNVALVESHWIGHHPLYFKEFVRTLLDLGCNVLALCPHPEDVSGFLVENGVRAEGRLELETFNRSPEPSGYQWRLRRLLAGGRTFQDLRSRVRAWERRAGAKADLVFFACIYDGEFQYFPCARLAWPFRWSGLYLQVSVLREARSPVARESFRRINALFGQANIQSLAVLDEGVAEELARVAGIPVVLFPDFTDVSTGDAEDGLAARLRSFAAGSPVVGIMGHLYPNKGVATLARLALDPRFRNLCFAFVGDLPWSSFSHEERELLASLHERSPNSFVHFQRVPSEASFNQVIDACDVVFAAYVDFQHSSNIVTKAAFLGKPVIVSDGGLMAERVREYRLGSVVVQDDLESIAGAIRALVADGPPWKERQNPRWEDFRARYSKTALRTAFQALLNAG
jgi:glycosyltransferase involved in cell wall biosynthesis